MTPAAPLKDVANTRAVFPNFQGRKIHDLCLTSKEATVCLSGMEIGMILRQCLQILE